MDTGTVLLRCHCNVVLRHGPPHVRPLLTSVVRHLYTSIGGNSFVKTYSASRRIAVPSSAAWEALTHLNRWLPALKTVERVEYSGDDFFTVGNTYRVHTPEGVVMCATLTEIDPTRLRVCINARVSVLRSQLTCEIRPEGNGCIITRTQSYPGIIGWIFTGFFNRREAEETRTYLDEWERVARESLRMHE